MALDAPATTEKSKELATGRVNSDEMDDSWSEQSIGHAACVHVDRSRRVVSVSIFSACVVPAHRRGRPRRAALAMCDVRAA